MKTALFSVFVKDLRSELRTRQSIYSVLLFITNAVILVLFSLNGTRLNAEFFSSAFWLILVFAASIGMSKSFVSEEERGTGMYLRLAASDDHVFVGKLCYNFLLLLGICVVGTILFTVIFDLAVIQDISSFALTMLLGSFGVSTAMSFSAALIARSQAKGAILPVISFPLLLPILFIGIEATTKSIVGSAFRFIASDLVLMLSYSIVLLIVCFWLFPFVWKD